MAYIDTSGTLGAQLQDVARLIIQKKQFKVADQRDRDQTVLAAWAGNPGQSIENVPGATDAYRRVFGKAPTPGQIGTPETLAQMTTRDIRDKANAGDRSLLDTADVVAATSQPGTRSTAALKTERATGEVNAQTAGTVADVTQRVVSKAATDIAAASPETQSAIGQSMLLPNSVTINELNARDATGKLRQNMMTAAQAALADPTGVGKGLDSTIRTVTGGRAGLVDAASAVAMGTDRYLEMMGQLVINNAAGRGVAENIQKGVAEDISKKSGGYWNPDEIVSYWTYQNSGVHSPAIDGNEKYQQFVRAQQLGGEGYLTTMAQNGSPVGNLFDVYRQFASKRDLSSGDTQLINDFMRNQAADIMTAAHFGPRAAYENNPEGLQFWDDAHSRALQLAPSFSTGGWTSGPSVTVPRAGYPNPNTAPGNEALNQFQDALSGFRGGSMSGTNPMRGAAPDSSRTPNPAP